VRPGKRPRELRDLESVAPRPKGVFKHEAAAVNEAQRTIYLTAPASRPW
jgi:hypothetical protein